MTAEFSGDHALSLGASALTGEERAMPGAGWVLRAARLQAGLGLPEAATATGMPAAVYASAEAGQRVLDDEAYGHAVHRLMTLPKGLPNANRAERSGRGGRQVAAGPAGPDAGVGSSSHGGLRGRGVGQSL
ncbi:MAG: hypothetical protein LBC97_05170 [Bifidobacteriaceae bacterium]|jgi:hypothetical protein|nr:hypothetical protein [Bifidobacteriaceae bacterium]